LKGLILGAGREPPDESGRVPLPRCLLTDPFGGRVMDWQLAAFKAVGLDDITFVGGYRIEEVGALYPELKYAYNPEWETSGVLESFYHARQEIHGGLLVSYADIVYGATACRDLMSGHEGVSIAVDRSWSREKLADTNSNILHKNLVIIDDDQVTDIGFLNPGLDISGEFVGLTYLGEMAVPVLNEFLENEYPQLAGKPFEQAEDIRKGYLTDLLRHLIAKGVPIRAVDIGSDWAEMEDVSKFAKYVLSTKSNTLDRLSYVVKSGKFCDQDVVTVREWAEAPNDVCHRIQNQFNGAAIAVRSSALIEDSWKASKAGAFTSILNVDSGDFESVRSAIDEVVASYQKYEDSANLDNQVLVQEQVTSVAMSGVVFTRDIESGAPYYVINYDDETAKTDSVTHGVSGQIKTVMVNRSAYQKVRDSRHSKLLGVIREIEEVTGCKALDIEFALNTDHEVYILQARPIAIQVGIDRFSEIEIEHELARINGYLREKFKPATDLFGETTVLADMPDWNPAEMIGVHPRPLAASLYYYLIMNTAWRDARGKIGYHNPRPRSLMVSIGGHPYVDVRCSFNNLLPAGLEPSLAEKLVNHYIAELQNDPSKHDKIEFEICFTCLDFQFEEDSNRLLKAGFSKQEVHALKQALNTLTNRIVCGEVCPFEELESDLVILQERTRIAVRSLETPEGILEAIDTMLEDCIKYGTIPFSILARYAFISNSLLRSLVARGVLTEAQHFEFLNSIDTVASEMVLDLNREMDSTKSLKEFLQKYGHLRPGTYEISSLRYDEAPDIYFRFSDQYQGAEKAVLTEDTEKLFSLSKAQEETIAELIVSSGFTFSVDEMFEFMKKAIAMREFGKFHFTRTVSEILLQLQALGEHYGLTRDDISYVGIEWFKRSIWCVETYPFAEQLKHAVDKGRGSFQASKAIKLPHIIFSSEDIYAFDLPTARPNFVTSKQVIAPLFPLGADSTPRGLDGRIVLVEGADPGYDWIFAHNIAGLITKYGGAASHMTIRAAEFGIPAAIGCGEGYFNKLENASSVELNCAAKKINVL